MVENFEVGLVYPLRTYERHQFCFQMEGKEYKGDYVEDTIHWLHPHPKQDISDKQLHQIEDKIYDMLGHHGIKEDIENIEVERVLNKAHISTDAHRFKLQVEENEFKGVYRDDSIDWFHPKPQGKLEHAEIANLEKKVHEKIRGYH